LVLSNRNSLKLLPYILFEKYINILALQMTSPGNRHCANCIGTLSFPVLTCAQKLTKSAKSSSRNQTKKVKKRKKLKGKKWICPEASVNSPWNREVSPEEEKEGCGEKDLQQRKVSSLGWKSSGVMNDESG